MTRTERKAAREKEHDDVQHEIFCDLHREVLALRKERAALLQQLIGADSQVAALLAVVNRYRQERFDTELADIERTPDGPQGATKNPRYKWASDFGWYRAGGQFDKTATEGK